MKELATNYPHLTELMEKFLYQSAAPSMEEAIGYFASDGEEVVLEVLSEIDDLCASDTSEAELYAYVSEHSWYMVPEGAGATLHFIRAVLASSLDR